MAIDEIERTAMVQQLINTLGEQPANTLMKCILPDGADQVATKADIRALEAATKADIRALEAATKADLRALQTATKADLRALQTATKADLRALEHYVDAAISTALAKQTRMLMLTMASFMLTIWVPLTIGALT
ncbi:hypothetical protein [Candidatus Poriferisodalis sp.]|uniref:hypothetical protein n=1 Tax=Candidatus Poriferisodalis sp. TaxID=3101277 RepID=UPI003B5ABF14